MKKLTVKMIKEAIKDLPDETECELWSDTGLDQCVYEEDVVPVLEECFVVKDNLIIYGNWRNIDWDDYDTVLSLIKEQEKQIENTTENYKNLIEDISMLAKELGLEDDATIDEIYIAIKRLKQKDKQIDLMAEELWGEFYLTYMNGYGINSKEELKQYFERKVEDVKD